MQRNYSVSINSPAMQQFLVAPAPTGRLLVPLGLASEDSTTLRLRQGKGAILDVAEFSFGLKPVCQATVETPGHNDKSFF
jgi:hypothetical protein